MIKEYYRLIKPGIVYGNALTIVAGFLFASGANPDWLLLLYTLLGVSSVVASGCVFNNYIDRGIDSKMERTKTRPLVAGTVPPEGALLFGATLGILSIFFLYFTNPLTLALTVAGFVIYVGLYTPLKHKSGYAVYVGAFAGAVPLIAGYTAVSNTLDIWTLYLFIFMFVWQLFHFQAIAYYRYDEYHSAGVPLLITSRPSDKTKKQARAIFLFSLVILLIFCAGLSLAYPLALMVHK